MERFPLKSSVPKTGSTYQSVFKKGSSSAANGRGGPSPGDDDMVDITPGLQQAGDAGTTPTSHGTFQLYEHSGRNSTASANSRECDPEVSQLAVTSDGSRHAEACPAKTKKKLATRRV